MKKVYLLPNVFTTASLFAGLMAILNIFNVADAADTDLSRYTLSCWLILLSAFLDLLDGWVARMTRSESVFGMHYDSLADVVAFGVAPSLLIYTRLANMENRHAAEVIATLYVICGALRLARFNVQKSRVEKLSFTGLPIPAAAGTIVACFLFFQHIDPDWDKQFVLNILPILIVGLSYLMVSKVSYPSFKQLRLEERKSFSALPVLVLIVAIVFALKNYFEALLFLGFGSYVVWGLVRRAVQLAHGGRRAASPDTVERESQG
jgi:CDP-diacylglycerol---serine O-phosphatidyltransferase